MKFLVLLALAGLATASDLELGDRIFATEEECGRIYKLNEHWSTSNFHEQAVQYVDLYLICLDSLNEDKYAYIDHNHVDMSHEENDKFPIMTSEGEIYVKKPPHRKPKDQESMKKRLAEYLTNTGGKMNPMFRLMTIQSEMSQDIIDKQVECEVLALIVLKHPDDKDNEAKHTDCMNKLNCIKEKFMSQHKFTREMYPDFFPILYKMKGTMIKTPPKLESSICETPDSPEGNKRELEKWMSGIEFLGEKMLDVGEAGTEFIEKLVKKGMGGGEKLLTRDELNDIMTDVQSVTISDDDDDDDEDADETYSVYGDVMLVKLAELEAKGIQITNSELEKVQPALKNIENIASSTGEQLKKIEEINVKPAINKAAHDLSLAESTLKQKSKDALAEFKDSLTSAGSIAKDATSKAKEEGSIMMSKLMAKRYGDGGNEEPTDGLEQHHEEAIENSHGWLSNLIDRMIRPDYLPNNYNDIQQPSLLKILKEMGGRDEDGKDKMSDDELVKMLKSLKANTKQKAKELNLKKGEITKSADIVKGIMHALLTAAKHGVGAAKDMNSQEIDTAKSVVDHLVDYATAEILDEAYENEEDNEDDGEDNHETKKDSNEESQAHVTQDDEVDLTTESDSTPDDEQTSTTTSGQVENSKQPAENKTDQIASTVQDDEDKNESDAEAENENNEDVSNSEKKLEVPDIK